MSLSVMNLYQGPAERPDTFKGATMGWAKEAEALSQIKVEKKDKKF